ncbi:MAG: YIP1 family protein [Gammaproteobacteria bacterium]|nr:YIP1 family protein [Gammaproteobacteria bacterium]
MDNKTKLSSIINDAVQVVKTPVDFYKNMAKTGGFTEPVIFLIVMSVISGLMIAVFSLIGLGMAGGAGMAGVGAVVVMPVFALFSSFISTGIIFVIWKLMGSNENYQTAYRCVAYAAAIYPFVFLLSVIPYLGSLVGVVWGVYLMIIAGIEVHQLNTRTVLIVFGVIGLFMLIVNLSSEMTTRKMSAEFESMSGEFKGFVKSLEKYGDDDEITPEEAGKALGEFLKGLEEVTRDKN